MSTSRPLAGLYSASAPSPGQPGFRLIETVRISCDTVPTDPLAGLVSYWMQLSEDGLPSLADADPDRLQVIPGRIHPVRVEGNRFRFLN